MSDAGLPPPHRPTDRSTAAPPPPPPPPPPPVIGMSGPGRSTGQGVFVGVLPIARWTVIALAAVAVLQVVTITLSWMVVDDAEAVVEGRLTADDFVGRYAGVAVVSLLMAIVGVALWVLVIVWMHRIATNARRLGREGRWSPGWAIGGWFCPPVLFVIPFLQLRELWRASDSQPGDSWRRAPVSSIVTVWWVLYGLLPAVLIPFGVSVAFSGVGGGNGSALAEQIRDDLTLQTASAVLSVAAAIAFGLLVRRLSTRQAVLTGEVAPS